MQTVIVENRHSEKRLLILQAARRCFIQHGFHATGMAEICHATGMSPGNLYRYFPSKSSIIMAIVDESRQQVMPIYEKLQDHPDPVEGTIEAILHLIEFLSKEGESSLYVEILAEIARNKEIRKACHPIDLQMQDVLRKLLERGIRSRKISSKINVDATVLWLIAFVDGAAARIIATPSIDIKSITSALAHNMRQMLSPGK